MKRNKDVVFIDLWVVLVTITIIILWNLKHMKGHQHVDLIDEGVDTKCNDEQGRRRKDPMTAREVIEWRDCGEALREGEMMESATSPDVRVELGAALDRQNGRRKLIVCGVCRRIP